MDVEQPVCLLHLVRSTGIRNSANLIQQSRWTDEQARGQNQRGSKSAREDWSAAKIL